MLMHHVYILNSCAFNIFSPNPENIVFLPEVFFFFRECCEFSNVESRAVHCRNDKCRTVVNIYEFIVALAINYRDSSFLVFAI